MGGTPPSPLKLSFLGGQQAFSQKGFAYDFAFLLAFLLATKIIRFSKKMGGPPFNPQIVIPWWTAGGVCVLWVS